MKIHKNRIEPIPEKKHGNVENAHAVKCKINNNKSQKHKNAIKFISGNFYPVGPSATIAE